METPDYKKFVPFYTSVGRVENQTTLTDLGGLTYKGNYSRNIQCTL